MTHRIQSLRDEIDNLRFTWVNYLSMMIEFNRLLLIDSTARYIEKHGDNEEVSDLYSILFDLGKYLQTFDLQDFKNLGSFYLNHHLDKTEALLENIIINYKKDNQI